MDSNVKLQHRWLVMLGLASAQQTAGMSKDWLAVPSDWLADIQQRKDTNLEKMSAKLKSNTVPMDFHSALGALRTIVKERPDAILVNEEQIPSILHAARYLQAA